MNGTILILMIVWSGYAHMDWSDKAYDGAPVHSNSPVGSESDWAKDGYWYEYKTVNSKNEAEEILINYERQGKKVKEARLITMMASTFPEMIVQEFELFEIKRVPLDKQAAEELK